MAPKAKFIQEGKSIDYTPGSDVNAGDVVVQKDLVGVAKLDIVANTLGALAVVGVFDIQKANEAFSAGDEVYWDADGDPYGGDAGTGAATGTAAGNVSMGYALADAGATDTTVRTVLQSNAALNAEDTEQLAIIPVEDLAANGDIAARPIFVHPRAVTLTSLGILTEGSPAGVDDDNTAVIAVADDASNAIVSKTYNTAAQPPDTDYADLGALDATHKVLAAEEHITLSVTQGTTADLPAFSVIVRYTVN